MFEESLSIRGSVRLTNTREDGTVPSLSKEILIVMKIPKKSYCVCGHTGGGKNTQHDTERVGADGHGPCKGCPCEKFTWHSFDGPPKDPKPYLLPKPKV